MDITNGPKIIPSKPNRLIPKLLQRERLKGCVLAYFSFSSNMKKRTKIINTTLAITFSVVEVKLGKINYTCNSASDYNNNHKC